jgi:gamma-butyrobetaine dioxygenase
MSVSSNVRVEIDGEILRLRPGLGLKADLPLAWLRDACRCAECRHPSGQRLLDPAAIPVDLKPTNVRLDGDELGLEWWPERHRSVYSLRDVSGPTTPPAAAERWDATSGDLPHASYTAIVGDDAAAQTSMLTWLSGVERIGCGVLSDVPVTDGAVADAAELFSYVRHTNYGRWFDVRTEVDPTNLANTSLGLAPHTDNPYRDPVPTLQLLHCLESSAAGGENILVDGWRIAEEVRAAEPRGFALLSERSVTFSYRDATAELSAHRPIVEIDSDGEVRSVRFNARSMQRPSMPPGEMVFWYEAYLLFARLLNDPRFHVRFRLDPGELFIVDNRRVLHGRTAFAGSGGSRHLQGCYADIDGMRSTIGVLARRGVQ